MGAMEHRFLRCISVAKIRESGMVDWDKEERTSETGARDKLGPKIDTIPSDTTRLIVLFISTNILYILLTKLSHDRSNLESEKEKL